MALKHKKTSAIADGADTGLVRPSDWNDDHKADFSGLVKSDANGALVQATAGTDYQAPVSTTSHGALINSATAKTTPVDADMVGLMDSAASNVLKKLSWANIKATLKSYFDTLYALTGHLHTGTYEPANANIQTHIGSTSNPHSTTAAQVGAPTTTGAGASGTWGVSVTGSAARMAVPDTRNAVDQPQNKTGNSITADFKLNTSVNSPPVTASGTYSHIITVAGWDTLGGSGGWPTQLSIGNGIAVRQAVDASTWGAWRTLIHSANYNSYSPTLTGTGASGSWAINVTGSSASCTGNAATATTIQTARTINGTSFNGSANITTTSWGTARTVTIGSTGKSVDGSGNVTWTLAEIGAQATLVSGTNIRTINGTPVVGSGDISIPITSQGKSYFMAQI